ncbi:hypothetical protein ACFE04_020599 [Oxalis oulophora]
MTTLMTSMGLRLNLSQRDYDDPDEQVESHKQAAAATASDKFKDEIIPVSMKTAGAIEGLAASLIQVPTEVVKQRMQTGQFNSAPNVVHRYIVFVYLYDLVMMHHNVAGYSFVRTKFRWFTKSVQDL